MYQMHIYCSRAPLSPHGSCFGAHRDLHGGPPDHCLRPVPLRRACVPRPCGSLPPSSTRCCCWCDDATSDVISPASPHALLPPHSDPRSPNVSQHELNFCPVDTAAAALPPLTQPVISLLAAREPPVQTALRQLRNTLLCSVLLARHVRTTLILPPITLIIPQPEPTLVACNTGPKIASPPNVVAQRPPGNQRTPRGVRALFHCFFFGPLAGPLPPSPPSHLLPQKRLQT